MSHYDVSRIGCGCRDKQACIVQTPAGLRACHWVRVDRASGVGICSNPACAPYVAAWDAGENRTPPLRAKYLRAANSSTGLR